jgi:hypothetical protein
MAPKAADARKRFDRNHRFRGHGPLLQVVVHPYPPHGFSRYPANVLM